MSNLNHAIELVRHSGKLDNQTAKILPQLKGQYELLELLRDLLMNRIDSEQFKTIVSRWPRK
jgi:hypothetical protein